MSTNYVRKNFYIPYEQFEFLQRMHEISISEHVRRAIDQYIEDMKRNQVTFSPSKHGQN